ncbi:MAG: hypothetical protein BJ554DRAFT_5335 [Olpidium bornovanus]|uniref:Uncharacterized protein n=1 Tax=Olpidium bornovanus TaxID=278681 RepID=A0A8H8A0E7_9FUNG|nr:MAG: hypothetical protein BJ554DRAFT_5335 [Olpidium bornovanus]
MPGREAEPDAVAAGEALRASPLLADIIFAARCGDLDDLKRHEAEGRAEFMFARGEAAGNTALHMAAANGHDGMCPRGVEVPPGPLPFPQLNPKTMQVRSPGRPSAEREKAQTPFPPNPLSPCRGQPAVRNRLPMSDLTNATPPAADVVSFLLDVLPDQTKLDVQNDHGNTALHWAALNGRASIVDKLVKAGANARVRAQLARADRLFPVFWSTTPAGNAWAVFRSAVQIKNSSGHTPIYEAQTGGHKDLIEYFLMNVDYTEGQGTSDEDDEDVEEELSKSQLPSLTDR